MALGREAEPCQELILNLGLSSQKLLTEGHVEEGCAVATLKRALRPTQGTLLLVGCGPGFIPEASCWLTPRFPDTKGSFRYCRGGWIPGR